MGDEVHAAGNGCRRRVRPGLDKEKLLVRCNICARGRPRQVVAVAESGAGEAAADSGGAARNELLATCSFCGRRRPRQAAAIAEIDGKAAADSGVSSPG